MKLIVLALLFQALSSIKSKNNDIYIENNTENEISDSSKQDIYDGIFSCSKDNNSSFIYQCTEHFECEDKENKTCTCESEYMTYIGDDGTENKTMCNVLRKSQLKAFCLELFLGFGAGHFYRNAYLMASLKLVAFFIGIFIICLFPITAKCVDDCCDNDCAVALVSFLFYSSAVCLAFWYIYDLVIFGKNQYPDYRYYSHPSMYPW